MGNLRPSLYRSGRAPIKGPDFLARGSQFVIERPHAGCRRDFWLLLDLEIGKPDFDFTFKMILFDL